MRGSLDNPPIIIRQTRFQYILLLATLMFLGALDVASLSYPGNQVWKFLFLVLALGGLILFGRVVVSPGTLTLGPTGMVLWTGWTTWSYAWTEIDRFEMVPISYRYWVLMQPGFIYSDLGDKNVIGRSIATALGGGRGIAPLGDNWELSAEELIELLNSAQARWKQRS